MTNKAATFLSLKKIVKSYGDTLVINGLSADIDKGELVTFIGPSGCGKTTLLRCIAGFTEVKSGEIILDGRVINNDLPHKRETGMVFQNYALFPHLSVENNISYGLKIQKRPKNEIRKRVEKLLDLVHLPGLSKRRIDQLSGGQQQRVALARALSLNPKILLLDEPFSNLDANLRVNMRAEIKRIQKELNLSVIFVTHDQEEAMSISDRVMVISEGKVEQLGSPIDIYDRPATDFIAGFVGYVNSLEGKIQMVDLENGLLRIETEQGLIKVLAGNKDIKEGEKVNVVIRPENITLMPPDDIVRDNLFLGEISNSMYTGSLIKYVIKAGQHIFIAEQYNPRKFGIIQIGEKVAMEISKDLHILKKGG